MVAIREPGELVGAVLNRTWKLVRVIGQGGLGIVYEAQHISQAGRWAVKLLQHEFVEEPTTVARFLSEAEAAARLNHPGIVRVFEAQRAEDGTPYLVMELLEGCSLHAAMRVGRFAPARAVGVATQILQALAAVHAAGIIHRDIKPDNVFLLPGAPEQVKLLDLGLARVMDAAGGMNRKTKTGMILGTPGYMSPEQIKNVKESDLRSDLWAVGVILYELLSGRQAFGAPTDFARMTAALTEEIRPLSQVLPELGVWDAFFERALVKEPSARFQSAQEMLAALSSVGLGVGMTPEAPLLGVVVHPPVSASSPTWNGAWSSPAPTMRGAGSSIATGEPLRSGSNTRISADNPASPGAGPRLPPEVAVVVPRPPATGISSGAAWIGGLALLGLGLLVGFLLGAFLV